jgi:hypothetical protein
MFGIFTRAGANPAGRWRAARALCPLRRPKTLRINTTKEQEQMRINRNIVAVLALTALAFAAGRAGWLGAGPTASAQQVEEQAPEKMSPEAVAAIAAGTPGEHHRYLNTLIGEWEGTFKIWMEPGAEPMISEGTVSREWILDGRFVHEVVEASSDWGPFKGISYLGYNNVDGQYEAIWMDSMSAGIYFETGSLDPDTQVMRTRGTYRDPASGKVLNSRGMMDMSNPNRHTMVGYTTGPDGKEFKSFEGVMERCMEKK